MDLKILVVYIVCIIAYANGGSFDDFQKALDKAANDLNNIDKASADRFRGKQVVTEAIATTTTTTNAPAAKSCGGWFSKCEETTTTPPPTVSTTQEPVPTTREPCGGWFQPACQVTTMNLEVTTTPLPTTAPTSSSCGGWFSKCAEDAVVTTTTTTVPPPASTPEPCGGWFQKPCPFSLTVATTTPKPSTTEPTTAKSCGGWFSSACETTAVTTPPPSAKSGWGLFGTYAVTTTSTAAPESSSGWLSGIVSGFYGTVDAVKSTAGKAVDTALDVTSKIATASLNNGVDFFLAEIKLVVKTTGLDIVPLPDLDIPLYPGASLKASGGYFKSVLSISRGGDIVVSRDGLAFILDIPMQLTDMEIGFKNYSITVLMGMGTSGKINVGVKENRINIRIRLALSTSCSINLEKVDFAVLDGLDIEMTYGCSACGFITDKASTYLANFLKNTIRLQIQGQIDSILKKTLGENSLICSKFMGQ